MDIKKKLHVLSPEIKKSISVILKQLEQNVDALYELATIDEKTGVYNHKFFLNISEMELDKAKRGIGPLSILILDLDNFKKLNDTYGHLAGDYVLKRLGFILNSLTRKYDIASRFGGEEFVLLLPNTAAKRAKVVCDRIRREVEKDRQMKKYGVTFSGGLTEYKKGDTVKKMQLRADKGVYKAKKNGKNRIEVI